MAQRARKKRTSPVEDVARLEASKELLRAYLFKGEERYFRERAIAAVRARADAEGLEVSVYDGEDPDLESANLLADLASGSLFGGARLLVVRGADALLKPSGSTPAPLTRAVQRFVEEGEPPGALVLAAKSVRADHAAAKAIVKGGGALLDCRKLWDSPPPWDPDPRKSELAQWTLARGRELGLRLDAGQAVYVATATGNDLAAIEGELEKLKATGGRGLREVVGWNAGGSPWQLADDLLSGDRARAVAGVVSLFDGGFQDRSGARVVDATALGAMLTSALSGKVRTSLLASRALEAGCPPGEAADAAGLPAAPRARESGLALARSRPSSTWAAMLGEVGDLERRQKTGGRVGAEDYCLLALRWVSPTAGAPKMRR